MTHIEEMPDWDDDIDESVGQAFVESMTHDEIIGVLRKQGSVRMRSEPLDVEIADRLDRYRDALIRIAKHDRYGISPEMQSIVKTAQQALK